MPGPIGGISPGTIDSNPLKPEIYDRLLAQGSGQMFMETLVALPILLQMHGSAAQPASEGAGSVGPLIQSFVNQLNQIDWAQIGEFFSRLGGHFKMALTDAEKAEAPKGPVKTPAVKPQQVSPLPREPARPEERDESVSAFESGVEGLVLAAALAVLSPRKRAAAKSRREGLVLLHAGSGDTTHESTHR
jgi:hypothetical protein